jgi:hypothetical protein
VTYGSKKGKKGKKGKKSFFALLALFASTPHVKTTPQRTSGDLY